MYWLILLLIVALILIVLIEWKSALFEWLVFSKWHGDRNSKKVALTFDDSPNSIFTPQILDVLKKNGMRATFFLIGLKVYNHREIVGRILSEGHEIGNHSLYHSSPPKWKRPFGAIDPREEVGNTQQAIQDIIVNTTGRAERPKFFRTPNGCFGRKLWKELKRNRLVSILFSNFPDPKNQGLAPEQYVEQVLSKLKGGDIILLHDGDGQMDTTDDPSNMIKALTKIIDGILERGYIPVTLSELLH